MVVHTFELSNKVSISKAKMIQEELFKSYKVKQLEQGILMEIEEVNPISKPGIVKIAMTKNSSEYYTLKLEVEPQSLIMNKMTTSLFDCSPESKERLNAKLIEALSELSCYLPTDPTKWRLSRIDYAVNLKSEYVNRCVTLSKRAKDPYRYMDTVRKDGSSYRSCKSTTLNFYDKLDHLKKTAIARTNPNILEEAKGIFRIEVQCRNRNKLNQIKKKYGLPKIASLFDYLNTDIAKDVVLGYYRQVIGAGDYYNQDRAFKMIETTSWSKRKKGNIKNWMQLIAQVRSVSKARKQYEEGTVLAKTKEQILVKGSQNTFSNYIKSCEEIGLNPYIIPRDWGIEHIANPFSSYHPFEGITMPQAT